METSEIDPDKSIFKLKEIDAKIKDILSRREDAKEQPDTHISRD